VREDATLKITHDRKVWLSADVRELKQAWQAPLNW
jgi:hypothetical protein